MPSVGSPGLAYRSAWMEQKVLSLSVIFNTVSVEQKVLPLSVIFNTVSVTKKINFVSSAL